HIGDSIAKEAGAGLSLEELVAPPDGLKHQLLREASRDELVDAMTRSLKYMRASGTSHAFEFREGGAEGIDALREAATGIDLTVVALGRGDTDVLEIADGYGASGAADGDFSRQRAACRNEGKPFAIHAGEVDAGDINPALDLDPDLLVHMVHAEEVHLDRVDDSDIPVAICPRSNLDTGVGLPPVRDLLDRTTVALGTDNVFLNAPSMFRELEFAEKLFDITAREALEMATVAGAEVFDLNAGCIEPGREGHVMVLDGDSNNLAGYQDPIRAIVRRADVGDVASIRGPGA
ncbi:MAG: amidohydrolase family protein, partial [Halobacteriaceae archaeon]